MSEEEILELEILKVRRGVPTVIRFDGRDYVYRPERQKRKAEEKHEGDSTTRYR